MGDDDATPMDELPTVRRKWLRRTVGLFAGLIALLAAVAVFLDTPAGHRVIAGYIGELRPESGLRIEVGNISGSIYSTARLHDVVLFDPDGEFMRIPVADLDWRPIHWLANELDIRSAVLREGTLSRIPEFNPRSSETPILPDFDMRVDRFEIDRLTVEKGIAGEQRTVNFLASALVRDSQVRLQAGGKLGGEDKMKILLVADPDKDLFDVDLDYHAPAGGLLAELTGAKREWFVRLSGKGGWKRWDGNSEIRQGDRPLAAFKLHNRDGVYEVSGDVWPHDNLDGPAAQLAGQTVHLDLTGKIEKRKLDGRLSVATSALRGSATGSIDLVDNRFDSVRLSLLLLDPKVFGEGLVIEDGKATALVDGPFAQPLIKHHFGASKISTGQTTLNGFSQRGVARYDHARWTVTLDSKLDTIRGTGSVLADRQLSNATLRGDLSYDGRNLRSENLRLASSGLSAQLKLASTPAAQSYSVSGTAHTSKLDLEGVGKADATARFEFLTGPDDRWNVTAKIAGRLAGIENSSLNQVAGGNLRFSGNLTAGSGKPVRIGGAKIRSDMLDLAFAGRFDDSTLSLSGAGKHADYGHFTISAARTEQETSGELVLESPFDGAGLRDVHIGLVSIDSGFRLDTHGQSTLGPFNGNARLYLPAEKPALFAIDRLTIWRTDIAGDLAIQDKLISGDLDISGGGLTGALKFRNSGDGSQRIKAQITAKKASFGGEIPISIAQANLSAEGTFLRGHSLFKADIEAQNIGYANIFVGRMNGNAMFADGRGMVDLAVAGRRGKKFDLQLNAKSAPGQFTIAARGSLNGRAISMPRRAIVQQSDGGGWMLRPAQLNYGGGYLMAEGEFGAGRVSNGKLGLSNLPIDLAEVALPEIGIHGRASGNLEWTAPQEGPITGSLRLKISDFSRTGLTLASQPVDLALNGKLTTQQGQVKAVISGDGATIGRLSLNVDQLPDDGGLVNRLERGRLDAHLEFDGPAASIWRLAAIDAFDITGAISLRARANGRLANPAIKGTISGSELRVQSALTGTDVRDIAANGTFTGTQLRLTRMAGKIPGGGQVSGSGVVDFTHLFSRGPKLDIKLAAKKAAIIDRSDFSATVSGPLRILLENGNGVVAGRLRIDKANWRLGKVDSAIVLPKIATREINRPQVPLGNAASELAWRYLIDASGDGRLDVEGLGLESEWAANLRLRGTVDEPRIGGEANLVRGEYTFAGTDFELTKGKINFDEDVMPDPRMDIAAKTLVNDLEVDISIGGNASAPQISLRSTPALPEDEVLSRLLFGGGVTELSAMDAVQLGAAIRSLKSGGGMGPINRLRRAAGLDRLRILAPDPTLNRGTSLALGKRIGRRTRVEIITDGHLYNATELEFRLTSWLSLLGSVSSLNRKSATIEYRKDY